MRTQRIDRILLATLVGAAIGAPLVSFAYQIQGGRSSSFIAVGATIGVIVAVAFELGLVRSHTVCAGVGAILALTLFQVPVCDGSHIGMPLLGSMAGLVICSVARSLRWQLLSAAPESSITFRKTRPL